jgi:hypothetical protein
MRSAPPTASTPTRASPPTAAINHGRRVSKDSLISHVSLRALLQPCRSRPEMCPALATGILLLSQQQLIQTCLSRCPFCLCPFCLSFLQGICFCLSPATPRFISLRPGAPSFRAAEGGVLGTAEASLNPHHASPNRPCPNCNQRHARKHQPRGQSNPQTHSPHLPSKP